MVDYSQQSKYEVISLTRLLGELWSMIIDLKNSKKKNSISLSNFNRVRESSWLLITC